MLKFKLCTRSQKVHGSFKNRCGSTAKEDKELKILILDTEILKNFIFMTT